MKQLLEKIQPLIEKVKGKKPAVAIVSVLAVLLAYYAVSKGYISDALVNPDIIIKYVEDAFSSKAIDSAATQVVVDTVSNAIDTLQ
jgi:hypothetical protein